MKSQHTQNIAVIAGASGLTGSFCLQYLLENENFSSVIMLNRRPLKIKHPKLQEVITDYGNLPQSVQKIQGTHFFCCLGTTIKKAGSQQNFRKVDYDYVLQIAEFALQANAQQFCLISSMGADPASKVFYSRVKGEIEQRIQQLNLPAFQIFRPSLLVGERKESRPLERLAFPLMKIIEPLLQGPLKKYRAIHAATVARAMVDFSLLNIKGTEIYNSDQIQFYSNQLARRKNAQ